MESQLHESASVQRLRNIVQSLKTYWSYWFQSSYDLQAIFTPCNSTLMLYAILILLLLSELCAANNAMLSSRLQCWRLSMQQRTVYSVVQALWWHSGLLRPIWWTWLQLVNLDIYCGKMCVCRLIHSNCCFFSLIEGQFCDCAGCLTVFFIS